MSSTRVIGIDLGTTNSVVCAFTRGATEVVPIDGRRYMPSAITVLPDGTIKVGNAARQRAVQEPTSSISSAKASMGDPSVSWTIGEQLFTPSDVASLVLGRLRKEASTYFGEDIRRAVVTVPAYFTATQKADTQRAADIAGLELLELIPEPTAAALSYGIDRQALQNICVYDFGGGTFDVSVLRVENRQFRVLAVGGDSRLGGDNIDHILARHILRRAGGAHVGLLRAMEAERPELIAQALPKELGVDYRRVLEAAREAKHELSVSETAEVLLTDLKSGSIELTVNRDAFNELIRSLVTRTITISKDTLREAGLRSDVINRVILVGGSTRNLLVRQQVAAALKEPWVAEHVDEVVAEGAALYAANLFLPSTVSERLVVSNVTPHSLGIRVTRSGNPDVFHRLIARNSPVPCQAESDEFTTSVTGQGAVVVSVYQGEEDRCSDNAHIGSFRLDGIPKSASKPKVHVQFELNASDLLVVTARCDTAESSTSLDVTLVSLVSEKPTAPKAVDVIFLLDTSGSMSDEIEGVKKSCLEFAEHITSSGADCRLGLVDFAIKSPDTDYTVELFGLKDPETFARDIAVTGVGRIGYGGCYLGNSNTIPVVDKLVSGFGRSGDRMRVVVILSDEVGNDIPAMLKIQTKMQEAQIQVHSVGVPGSFHQKLAESTGGSFWSIQDSRGAVSFATVLSGIAQEITAISVRE